MEDLNVLEYNIKPYPNKIMFVVGFKVVIFFLIHMREGLR